MGQCIFDMAGTRVIQRGRHKRYRIDADSAVAAKLAALASAIGYGRRLMAKWAIAEKGHFWMETIRNLQAS